jgi:hypothetical protein
VLNLLKTALTSHVPRILNIDPHHATIARLSASTSTVRLTRAIASSSGVRRTEDGSCHPRARVQDVFPRSCHAIGPLAQALPKRCSTQTLLCGNSQPNECLLSGKTSSRTLEQLSDMEGILQRRPDDPVVLTLSRCKQCHSAMGPLRVHQGTTKPKHRGKVVQTVSILPTPWKVTT